MKIRIRSPCPQRGLFAFQDTFSVSRRDDLVLAAVENKGAKPQRPRGYGFGPGLFLWDGGAIGASGEIFPYMKKNT